MVQRGCIAISEGYCQSSSIFLLMHWDRHPKERFGGCLASLRALVPNFGASSWSVWEIVDIWKGPGEWTEKCQGAI